MMTKYKQLAVYAESQFKASDDELALYQHRLALRGDKIISLQSELDASSSEIASLRSKIARQAERAKEIKLKHRAECTEIETSHASKEKSNRLVFEALEQKVKALEQKVKAAEAATERKSKAIADLRVAHARKYEISRVTILALQKKASVIDAVLPTLFLAELSSKTILRSLGDKNLNPKESRLEASSQKFLSQCVVLNNKLQTRYFYSWQQIIEQSAAPKANYREKIDRLHNSLLDDLFWLEFFQYEDCSEAVRGNLYAIGTILGSRIARIVDKIRRLQKMLDARD